MVVIASFESKTDIHGLLKWPLIMYEKVVENQKLRLLATDLCMALKSDTVFAATYSGSLEPSKKICCQQYVINNIK